MSQAYIGSPRADFPVPTAWINVYAQLVELDPFGDINKYPAGVGAETHLIQRQKMISTNLPRLLMMVV